MLDTVVSAITKIEDKFLNKMFSADKDVKPNKDILEYWKNKILTKVKENFCFFKASFLVL